MNRTRIAFALIVLAGFVCFAAYHLVGSHVDEQGFLREPFFLIPISYLLFFIGVTGFVANLAWHFWLRRSQYR